MTSEIRARTSLAAVLLISILASASPSYAEQREATGLSQPCSGQCAAKLEQMKAEAIAEATKKTQGAKIIGAPRVNCWIVDRQHFVTRCTAKVTYDLPKARASGVDCDSNPYASGCPRTGVGTLNPPTRSAAQIKCEKVGNTWENGRCKPWCEGKPPGTIIPNTGGGSCDGE